MITKLSLGLALLGAVVPCVGQAEQPGVTQRPLSDFLDAQGSDKPDGDLFFPPVLNYVGTADAEFEDFALLDYAGVAAEWLEDQGVDLGTEFSGTILERRLPDGRAEVTVRLRTRNALVFAQSISDIITPEGGLDFAGAPTTFGHKAVQVAEGAEPALGWVHLDLSFIIDAPGAPLPDFLEITNWTPDFAPVSLTIRSQAIGETYEGDPARLVVVQIASTDETGELVFTEEIVEVFPLGPPGD